MKYFITLLFIAVLLSIGIGFYLKPSDEATGNLIIGLSLMVGFFVLMPVFIYHRWKNKNVKDYMLTKENIEKMQDFQKDKKI
jgi:flagellar biosynthesis protein FliP